MDYIENYRAHLANLIAKEGEEAAMASIVGGDYEAVGQLEADLLAALKVSETATILDVGCGTGRLGFALRRSHRGLYIGTDIIPEMLAFAGKKIGRYDWRYLICSCPPIPLADASVDVVCLFSVFTHLLDEDVFNYLKEIRRLLRPGGLAIFSYLDFSVPSHWTVFEHMLADPRRVVLNRFTSKDALGVLANKAGLERIDYWDGHLPKIKLRDPIRYADGRVQSGMVGFGQSLCICRREQSAARR